jgi:hypothetical protein
MRLSLLQSEQIGRSSQHVWFHDLPPITSVHVRRLGGAPEILACRLVRLEGLPNLELLVAEVGDDFE